MRMRMHPFPLQTLYGSMCVHRKGVTEDKCNAGCSRARPERAVNAPLFGTVSCVGLAVTQTEWLEVGAGNYVACLAAGVLCYVAKSWMRKQHLGTS